MTMNSWKSAESWACLPPFRMLNMGTGMMVGAPGQRWRYRGMFLEAAAAWATAKDTPRTALAPRLRLFGVPSSLRSFSSRARWSRADMPATAGAIFSLTLATAVRTPFPPKRALSPSRSSTASWAPVLAPEGTAARPREPSSRMTSTSTVGLPRESKTSLARAFLMSLIAASRFRPAPLPGCRQLRWPCPQRRLGCGR